MAFSPLPSPHNLPEIDGLLTSPWTSYCVSSALASVCTHLFIGLNMMMIMSITKKTGLLLLHNRESAHAFRTSGDLLLSIMI